jgi:hypothetical protein
MRFTKARWLFRDFSLSIVKRYKHGVNEKEMERFSVVPFVSNRKYRPGLTGRKNPHRPEIGCILSSGPSKWITINGDPSRNGVPFLEPGR